MIQGSKVTTMTRSAKNTTVVYSTNRILGTCGKKVNGCGEHSFVLFVAVREGVHVGVVEQRVVAVSPRELLAPDSEVVIGNELRGGVGVLVSHAEGVHVPEDDDGDGGKEEALLPGLVATSMTTAHLPGKGRSLGGDTKELLVGPCEADERWSWRWQRR